MACCELIFVLDLRLRVKFIYLFTYHVLAHVLAQHYRV